MDDEQAMIIEIDLSQEEMGQKEILSAVRDIENQISAVIPEQAEVDGNDIAQDEATIYVYGSDADAIFKATEGLLKKSNFDDMTITLRYGNADDPKVKEKRFSL